MATAKKAVAKKSVKSTVIETHHDRVDWRSLYLYAVCLITLLVVLFSTVSLINAIMNAVLPLENAGDALDKLANKVGNPIRIVLKP